MKPAQFCGQMDHMKKLVWLIMLALVGSAAMAQTNTQVANLSTLGRVWGFLKYYHPAAARGKPDWDKELVRMIPLIEQAATVKIAGSLLENWYHSLPAAPLAASPVNWAADSIDRVFTEKDIAAFQLPLSLINEFQRLYAYHQPDTSRYITRTYRGIHYDHIIHTEDDYAKPEFPDRSMRLLALFRYWNTIAYFYPHRIAHWHQVLPDYIRAFSKAANAGEYQHAVRQLIHELPDAHSFIQVPGAVYYFYPFRIDYIDGKYLIGACDDSMAIRHGYRVGDEIVSVNGKSVSEREQELQLTTTGTNKLSRHRNIAAELLKPGDTVLQVGFKRGSVITSKLVALNSWEVYKKLPGTPEKPLWQEVDKGIWYVRFCAIRKADTLQSLFRDIRQAKQVIWDMRGYPNYQVTTQLGKYFFAEKLLITRERNASDRYPGAFVNSPYYYTPVERSGELFNGSLIVLVDEHTQSLAESVTALLRLKPNTVTMGRQTAGTTGNITWLSLPGGIEVSYTGVGVTGMEGSFTQGRGVKVDIPVKLTQASLQHSKDYMLDKAIGYARGKSGRL